MSADTFRYAMQSRHHAHLAFRPAIFALALTAACAQRPAPPAPAPASTPAPQAVHRAPPAARTPLFATNRIVAFYGEPRVSAMGVLGSGSPDAVALRLRRQARSYEGYGKRVTPAFEDIAVAAQRAPGAGGAYHSAPDLDEARRYLAAARKMSGLLLVDIQPGRDKFLPLVRRFEPLLREPDVGLALDPEWEMAPTEVPGETIGGTTAGEVNAVAAYVAGIVRRYGLPQKLFVIHEFAPDMIAGRAGVRPLPELAMTFHIDGFGQRPIKLAKYASLATRDGRFHNGFKLFYDQDVDMLTPAGVMALRPQPDLITYQ